MAKKTKTNTEIKEKTALPAEAEAPEQAAPPEVEPPVPEEKDVVRCTVTSPGGIYLRSGPGKAYRSVAVLPSGMEVLCADVEELLREDRQAADSMWIKALCREGTGWVDGAWLARQDAQ